MNYHEFKYIVQDRPLIYSRDLVLHQTNKQIIRNRFKRWHEKKLLIKLRRGVFLLNPTDRKINPSRAYIANQLYSPSYVSLEYALNYYGLIPERVTNLTSITTRKTMRFSNEVGIFVYQHIKTDAYRGFKMERDDSNLVFFIAEPEKAIVDFCYLNLDKFKDDYREVFSEYYRMQNLEVLKNRKIMHFVKLFNNDKLVRVTRALCRLISEARSRK